MWTEDLNGKKGFKRSEQFVAKVRDGIVRAECGCLNGEAFRECKVRFVSGAVC